MSSKDILLEQIDKLENENIRLVNLVDDLELRLQNKQRVERPDLRNKVMSVTKDKGITFSHRKENMFNRQFTLIYKDNDRYKEGIIARFYGKVNSTCCVWIRLGEDSKSGSGKASGYGYHMDSASFDDAIVCCGIKLENDVNGRGDEAVVDAMLSIASYYGIKDCSVLKAHG